MKKDNYSFVFTSPTWFKKTGELPAIRFYFQFLLSIKVRVMDAMEVYKLFGRAKDLERHLQGERDRMAISAMSARQKGEAEEDENDELFYDSRSPEEVSPVFPIIVEFNTEIKTWLAKHPERMWDLTSREFEELVADMLKDFGFEVELTGATRDGGKDIYAYIRNQITSILVYVEAKKWRPPKNVGLEVVQRLYGVQQSDRAHKSMIVTSSFFTMPAIKEAQKNRMDLNNYEDLKNWLKRYK